MFSTLALFSDIGGGEMVAVGIIALLLFGRDLPAVSRKVGRVIAEFKRNISAATGEIKREMDAAAGTVGDDVQEIKSSMREIDTSIRRELSDTIQRKNDAQSAQKALPQNGSQPASASASAPPPAELPELPKAPASPAGSVARDPHVTPAAALDTFQPEIKPPTQIPRPIDK